VRSLLRRLESGGALSCAGVSAPARPFLAALLRHALPNRPTIIVTDGLKTQEIFQQDLETWLRFAEVEAEEAGTPKSNTGGADNPSPIPHSAFRTR